MPIGRIAGAFGVRGEIKVEPLTDFPERFKRLERVFVGSGRKCYGVAGSRRHGEQVLLRLEGVETPEQVALLGHEEIFVPRSEAVPLPEGHYYLEDLIGVRVVTTEGQELGSISDVLRTGGNDVYVVGEGRGAVLIPGIKDAVRELDLMGRTMVVEPWVFEVEG